MGVCSMASRIGGICSPFVVFLVSFLVQNFCSLPKFWMLFLVCQSHLLPFSAFNYRKILKISPGAYIFQRPFLRGLFLEGLIYGGKRFKIDWASLIIGRKFSVFALFCFVFEGNFPSTSPRGAYIWRVDLTEGFFALPDWGAYTWRGLFSELYSTLTVQCNINFFVAF